MILTYNKFLVCSTRLFNTFFGFFKWQNDSQINKHHNLYLERNHVSQIERQEINYYLRYNLIEPEI